MKNRAGAWLLAVLLLIMNAGCTVKPEPTEPSETAPPVTEWVLEDQPEVKKYQDVELSFATDWKSKDPRTEVLRQAAELFYEQTGAVIRITRPREDGRKAGDILQLTSGELSAENPEGLLDLGEMSRSAGYDQHSFEALTAPVLEQCGKLAAIVQCPYVTGIYYNRSLMEAAGTEENPRNFEQFCELCETLRGQELEPLTLDTERSMELFLLHLSQYLDEKTLTGLLQNGGWKEQDAAARGVFDIWNFADAGYMTARTPTAYPDGQNRIGMSNSVMAFSTSRICHQVNEAARTTIRWGMFPCPAVGTGEPCISVDADVLAVGSECREPQAAFDFIMMLCTGEFDQLRADLTCSVAADPTNISPIAGAAEALQNACVTVLPNQVLNEKQYNAIASLWRGGYEQPEDFLKAMDRTVMQKR